MAQGLASALSVLDRYEGMQILQSGSCRGASTMFFILGAAPSAAYEQVP